MPGVWKVSVNHRHYPGTASFPMRHIGNRYVLLEKNGLSDSGRCLLKVDLHHSEEITKFHLSSHVQFLQCYSITYRTSSPNHPRSNRFVEKIVRVAKKLMDKAGKERKPWISGLFDYRVTPQSGSIASPLQLLTQRTPREKNLP